MREWKRQSAWARRRSWVITSCCSLCLTLSMSAAAAAGDRTANRSPTENPLIPAAPSYLGEERLFGDRDFASAWEEAEATTTAAAIAEQDGRSATPGTLTAPQPSVPPPPSHPGCTDPSRTFREVTCLPRLFWYDATSAFAAPFHLDGRQWGMFALGVLGVGAAAALDKQAATAATSGHNSTEDRIATDFRPFGSWGAFAVLGGLYGGGLIFQDEHVRGMALDGVVASLIAAGIVTPALKEIVGRSRPSAHRGTYVFNPFSGNASFPSGETTEAFAAASVIATESDSAWIKVASYLPAALVGFARMRENAHFLSDVTAGSLIGIGIGRFVAHLNIPLRDGRKMKVHLAPTLSRDTRGLVAAAAF